MYNVGVGEDVFNHFSLPLLLTLPRVASTGKRLPSGVVETVAASRSTSGIACWPTTRRMTVTASSWTGFSSRPAVRVAATPSRPALALSQLPTTQGPPDFLPSRPGPSAAPAPAGRTLSGCSTALAHSRGPSYYSASGSLFLSAVFTCVPVMCHRVWLTYVPLFLPLPSFLLLLPSAAGGQD